MNAKKAARALRELADALEEGEANDVPEATKSAPRARQVTDVDKERARKALRKMGVTV